MKVQLKRVDGACFQATNEAGLSFQLDGPPSLGGAGKGMRPMELVLVGLAGCSAMDVLHILGQQKEPLADLEVNVEAVRKDAVPAVFETIHLHFEATGGVAPNKLQRAVRLSMEKYCSVANMLTAGGVAISHSVSQRQ
jgi:putative redox protein